MSTTDEPTEPTRLTRRRALGRLGIGAAGMLAGPGLLGPTPGAKAAGTAAPRGCAAAGRGADPSRFGRLFGDLKPFAEPGPRLTAALLELGKPGGLLDANDDLSAGPVRLITDPSLSATNPNNPTQTAGTTFLGQFIDHDVTFDAGSRLGVPTEPTAARNYRSPALDLDSVYGAGYVAQQELYDAADHVKLRLESGGLFEDLPRRADGGAIVGDPRNDEHLIIAGLHCAFARFHNHCVDVARSEGMVADPDVFARARRLVTWHYHWIVLHDHLPQIVGQRAVDRALRDGKRIYDPQPGHAFMPVEFQGACYRMGHSQVRPSYRANLAGNSGGAFFGMIFDPAQDGVADPADMRGGCRAPRRFVGWQTFFEFGDGQVKPNKLIDTRISTPLFNLPLGAIATHDAPTALPQRTLLRHVTWSLPSGQDIARTLGAPVLSRHDLAELSPLGSRLDRSTPLWVYILKEAEVMEGGLHLGPVGGRIVAEVLVGLMRSDPGSWLATRPDWKPTLPARTAGRFDMVDLLTLAGVDPASRGQ
jgi:hypothetical protein